MHPELNVDHPAGPRSESEVHMLNNNSKQTSFSTRVAQGTRGAGGLATLATGSTAVGLSGEHKLVAQAKTWSSRLWARQEWTTGRAVKSRSEPAQVPFVSKGVSTLHGYAIRFCPTEMK